jgi:hypothetical protein
MIDPKALGDCGGCGGDINGISESIITASKYLVNGHMGLHELYKQLANAAQNPDDRATFTAQSEKHLQMAKDTAEVSVPEGGNDGNHSSEVRSDRREERVERA